MSAARTEASPILLIRPERSVSPDWYFFGVSPNSGPARFDDRNRAAEQAAHARNCLGLSTHPS
jgi:hypothetical protein